LAPGLARISAFKGKLKQLADQKASDVLKECETINFGKFLSELAASLCEAKLKSGADVHTAVQIASHLHQRYSDDFAAELTELLVKQLQALDPNAKRKPAEQKALAQDKE
jgi:hypothetical protein